MNFRRQVVLSMAISLAAIYLSGCNSRTLIITKDPVINTSNPRDFKETDPSKRQGESLTITIVGFTDEDFAKGTNNRFSGDSAVTSKDFYKDKGSPSCLKELDIVGAKHDGKDTIKVPFQFPAKFFDANDVLYVFAKFAGPTPGEVLPAAPVKFRPGSFSGAMRVHVGATTIKKN